MLLGRNENLIPALYHSKSKDPIDCDLEYSMYEFSNTVGALITYALIQSLNEKNRLIKSKKSRRRSKEIKTPWDWPFSIAEQSIQKVLHQLITSEAVGIVFAFHKKVWFEMAEKALQAYSKVYPRLYNKLSQLWQDFPNMANNRKNHGEYLNLAHMIRHKCNTSLSLLLVPF